MYSSANHIFFAYLSPTLNKRLKNIFIYSLLLLVLVAFNYKAISYLLDSSKKATTFMMDFEKEKSESEKSEKSEKEKEEDNESSEFFFLKHDFICIHFGLPSRVYHPSFFLHSSDHRNLVFMPPEQAQRA